MRYKYLIIVLMFILGLAIVLLASACQAYRCVAPEGCTCSCEPVTNTESGCTSMGSCSQRNPPLKDEFDVEYPCSGQMESGCDTKVCTWTKCVWEPVPEDDTPASTTTQTVS